MRQLFFERSLGKIMCNHWADCYKPVAQKAGDFCDNTSGGCNGFDQQN